MTDEEARKRAAEKSRRWRRANPAAFLAVKRRYRKNNPEKARAYDRLYLAKRREEINAARRARYAATPPEKREKQTPNRARINQQRRERRQRDPEYRLAHNIGAHMRDALRGRKARPWCELVGYSAADLRAHLEAQFEPWMAWANYGTEWHIDHIRPISSFSLPSEVRACWALSNLRPLSAAANLAKRNKWNPKETP